MLGVGACSLLRDNGHFSRGLHGLVPVLNSICSPDPWPTWKFWKGEERKEKMSPHPWGPPNLFHPLDPCRLAYLRIGLRPILSAGTSIAIEICQLPKQQK